MRVDRFSYEAYISHPFAPPASEEKAEGISTESKMRPLILVVEDEPALNLLMTSVLNDAGFSARGFGNGQEALEEIEHIIPDLIISDIMMPVMDGIQLCLKVRSNPATRTLPILFLTSLADREDRVLGFKVGADDYLTKPFDLEELVLRARALVKRASAEDEEQLFQGDISTIGLSSVLGLLEMEQKTGVLWVRHGDSTLGVNIRNGKILQANLGDDRDLEAVVEAFSWEDGRFTFDSCSQESVKKRIHASTMEFMLNAASLHDERKEEGKQAF